MYKKFSHINKYSVEETKNTEKITNIQEKIGDLVDTCLNIKVNNVLEEVINESISIDGKDDLVQQLSDLFQSHKINNQLSILEEAQYNGIKSVRENLEFIQEKQTPAETAKHRKRIESILSRSKGEVSEIEKMTNQQAESIKDGEKAYYRGMCAKSMTGDKKALKIISRIFITRSKELGY